MQDQDKLKEIILAGTVEVYGEKGIKFTMDDLARHLGMSKKTIYTVYREKKTLFMAMVDYVFDSIKESERKVVEDKSLNTVEKIRRILGVLPDSYKNVDLGQLYIEQFFSRDILVRNGIGYLDALDEIVNIIVDGIAVR